VTLVALMVIGLVVGGIFWMRDASGRSSGPGDLIAAPPATTRSSPTSPAA
jgi:hypothetical protein